MKKYNRNLIIFLSVVIILVVGCVVYLYENNKVPADQTHSQYTQQNLSNAPFIKVLSPNGGEDFRAGDSMRIIWQDAGLGSSGINIIWCKNNSGCNNIITRIQNMGTYSWEIPKTFSPGLYKIGVGNDDITNAAEDQSDAYFTILPSSSTCTNGATNYPHCNADLP